MARLTTVEKMVQGIGKYAPLLLRAHPSRWGVGRVHYAIDHGGGYVVAFCTNQPIHAEQFRGPHAEVTCLRCIKRNNRLASGG